MITCLVVMFAISALGFWWWSRRPDVGSFLLEQQIETAYTLHLQYAQDAEIKTAMAAAYYEQLARLKTLRIAFAPDAAAVLANPYRKTGNPLKAAHG